MRFPKKITDSGFCDIFSLKSLFVTLKGPPLASFATGYENISNASQIIILSFIVTYLPFCSINIVVYLRYGNAIASVMHPDFALASQPVLGAVRVRSVFQTARCVLSHHVGLLRSHLFTHPRHCG